jgi:hypothetical protein
MIAAISFLMLVCGIVPLNAQIVINEGSNKNYQTLADEDGDYPDWIELFNAGTETVNLFGYTLSDRIDLPAQWEFPAINLEPGQFLVVYCSEKDRKPIGPFQQVLNVTNYIPVAGWNSFPLNGTFEWDGVSSLLINTCSYSSTGYTVNATFSQTATAYPSTVYNFQDGSDAVCSTAYGSVVNQRPNIRLNGLTIGSGNIMNSPTDYPAPFGNWYWAARHQMIIPVNELIAAGLSAGPINNFALRVVNANGSINYDYFNVAFRAVVETEVSSAFTAVDANANLHTNFKISGEGETIYLFDPDQNIASEMFVGLAGLDLSTGSQPDATNVNFIFGAPTPGSSNNGAETFTEILLAPEFSLPNGIYTSAPDITITHQNGPSTTIYYTLDGSEPTVNDTQYNGENIPIYFSTSLKAKAFQEGKLPSPTAAASYLMGVYHHTPILSLTTDNANLYGDNGIFDNWWTDWQRSAHAAYFDEDQELIFSQAAGIQIDGGAGGSRSHPQHSFRLELAHSVLGEEAIEYAAIPNRSERTKFSNFYFRNGSNMYQTYPIKDAVQVECMAAEGHAYYSAWRPVTVYINGNYFGLYEMREKVDMEFFEESENAHPDSTDLLSLSYWYGGALRAVEGSVESFFDSYSEFNSLDPQSDNYWQQADTYFDLESYCDYIIAESWMANTDWPWNNIKIYRSNKTDFRWRFGVMDLENGMTPFGWTDAYTDMISYIINGDQNIPYINVFVQSIQNAHYRKYFINRYADMMNTSYRYERLENVANDMFDQTILEMPNQYQRWGDPNNISGQMQGYVNNHNAFLSALSQRTEQVRNHIEANFDLIAQVDVSLDVFPATAGKIKISTVVPESLPWTGVYFHGNPVRLTAYALPGYAFAYWEPNQVTGQTIFEPSIEVDISSDVLFTAVFVPTDVEGILLISEINFHSADSLDSGDWIEFFNAGNAALDLSNWKVKDANPWDSYIWPEGSTLLPGQRIILASDPVLFNEVHPDVPVYGLLEFNLSNGGESITVLNSINDTIVSVSYEETFPWQPSVDGLGRTLELRPGSTMISLPESWFAGCIGGSPGVAYSPCDEPLIISEVNYRSSTTANAGDWLELYNSTSETINLNGWKIRDSQLSSAYTFGESQMIPAGGYLLLYNDASAFSSRFPDVNNTAGPLGFQLSNDGEEIVIFDADNKPVYSLVYDVVLPWPAEANGGGYTMELLDYQGIACDGVNWIAGCPEGSPGSAYTLPCLPLSATDNLQFPAPSLFPNPSDGILNIVAGKGYSPLAARSELRVYNALGVQVHQSYHTQGSEVIRIDLASLPAGFYLISLRQGEQQWQWKWVLE